MLVHNNYLTLKIIWCCKPLNPYTWVGSLNSYIIPSNPNCSLIPLCSTFVYNWRTGDNSYQSYTNIGTRASRNRLHTCSICVLLFPARVNTCPGRNCSSRSRKKTNRYTSDFIAIDPTCIQWIHTVFGNSFMWHIFSPVAIHHGYHCSQCIVSI